MNPKSLAARFPSTKLHGHDRFPMFSPSCKSAYQGRLLPTTVCFDLTATSTHPTHFKCDQNIHAGQNVEHPRLKVVWATQKKAAMLEPTHMQRNLKHDVRIHENCFQTCSNQKFVQTYSLCVFQWLNCGHCFYVVKYVFFGDG